MNEYDDTDENKPWEVHDGVLTLCGLEDFDEAYHNPASQKVVTLCRWPHDNANPSHTHHFYISFLRELPFEDWVAAVKITERLLKAGEDVVLHCIHGRDRTGAIAYAVLRRAGYSKTKAKDTLNHIRPRMAKEWRKLMRSRESFHESLVTFKRGNETFTI